MEQLIKQWPGLAALVIVIGMLLKQLIRPPDNPSHNAVREDVCQARTAGMNAKIDDLVKGIDKVERRLIDFERKFDDRMERLLRRSPSSPD